MSTKLKGGLSTSECCFLAKKAKGTDSAKIESYSYQTYNMLQYNYLCVFVRVLHVFQSLATFEKGYQRPCPCVAFRNDDTYPLAIVSNNVGQGIVICCSLSVIMVSCVRLNYNLATSDYWNLHLTTGIQRSIPSIWHKLIHRTGYLPFLRSLHGRQWSNLAIGRKWARDSPLKKDRSSLHVSSKKLLYIQLRLKMMTLTEVSEVLACSWNRQKSQALEFAAEWKDTLGKGILVSPKKSWKNAPSMFASSKLNEC